MDLRILAANTILQPRRTLNRESRLVLSSRRHGVVVRRNPGERAGGGEVYDRETAIQARTRALFEDAVRAAARQQILDPDQTALQGRFDQDALGSQGARRAG